MKICVECAHYSGAGKCCYGARVISTDPVTGYKRVSFRLCANERHDGPAVRILDRWSGRARCGPTGRYWKHRTEPPAAEPVDNEW